MDRARHEAIMNEICAGREFRLKTGFRLKEDDLPSGRALFNLLASKKMLNGKAVLEILKDPRGAGQRMGIDLRGVDVSFLRGYLKWDDAEAADAYRVAQLNDLIRNIWMVTKDKDGNEIETRAYPGVQGEDGTFTRYSAENAANEAALGNLQPQEDILGQALTELESFIRKHLNIERLQGLCADLQAVVAKHRPRPR